MLKTLLATTAITGLMISGAWAQGAQSPAPTAPPPQTDTMQKPPTSDGASAQAPKFIASQGSDEMVSSKFKGADVLGPNNEHIGDVSDLLFTKEGQIKAYIVGVGGFLGIGEKNVAIDPSAFQPAADNNDPNDMKLKVSWTKEQLKDAPAFEYYKAPSRTTSTGTGTTGSNTGMSPRPATPAR
ncbi:MAG TPA: PRC-barrel domain-containing protein [Xanthobacteraceae bacterium]|nr:PRC-barrel domain-containing protein [Xanthobacteraceae bacterium]